MVIVAMIDGLNSRARGFLWYCWSGLVHRRGAVGILVRSFIGPSPFLFCSQRESENWEKS